jgi:hypothetical protein
MHLTFVSYINSLFFEDDLIFKIVFEITLFELNKLVFILKNRRINSFLHFGE